MAGGDHDGQLTNEGREAANDMHRLTADEIQAMIDKYKDISPVRTEHRDFTHAVFVGIPKGIKALPGGRMALHFVIDSEWRDGAWAVFDSVDMPVKVIVQRWEGEEL